jgi:squalene synthase HpnC
MPATDVRSGKSHGDENFPVASLLLAPGRRAPILAFYRFARLADDVADHPALTPAEKLDRLDQLEAGLGGAPTLDGEAAELRAILAAHDVSDEHARALLQAFRQDARVTRYDDWPQLLAYCASSAMPVGRFVLDLHGEARATWPASDAICAALQIINHLQDCAQDYHRLDRVYIPRDLLAQMGASVEDLGAPRASAPLLAAIRTLATRADQLLDTGAPLAAQVKDRRLSREIAVIMALARNNVRKLRVEDPLQGGCRTSKPQGLVITLATLLRRARPDPVHLQEKVPHDAGA